MDEDTTARPTSLERLEELSKAVTAGFATVNGQLTDVQGRLTTVDDRLTKVDGRLATVDDRLTKVDGRLTTVDGRLTTVDGRLTKIEGRLTTIEVFAENTDTLCKNIWDSQTSLERRMDEGFEQAKKERDEQFDVLKLAVHRWGERVDALEKRHVRATKRRR